MYKRNKYTINNIIFILALLVFCTCSVALANTNKVKSSPIRINYISEESNTIVTVEENSVDTEIGNGRVWITNISDITSKNSAFTAPANKTFIGWQYRDSVIGGGSVTSTSAYKTGDHFTQNEYYSLSPDETEINLIAVWGYTVYVDGVNGIDDNDGTLSSPVRTMGRAYEILARLDSGNANANITGFSVIGDSSTGYTFGTADTANLVTNFDGRIVVINDISYKDDNEGRYEYITYGDLKNSGTYDASANKTTIIDNGLSIIITNVSAATGYTSTDPVKINKSGTTYKAAAKTASGSYHFMLRKKVNSYSYVVNGNTYYTYGRLTQYTENLRAHVGKGLMTPINDGLVLVTTKDGATNYGSRFEFGDYTRYASGGDMIYKDIQFAFFYNSSLDKESQTYVCGYAANGNYLAIDENVTLIKDSTHIQPSVYGGGHAYRYNSNNYTGAGGTNLGNPGTSTLNNSRITVKSGSWYGAYSGSYGQTVGKAIATYGTTENNASVLSVYGGSFSNGIGMGHEGASAYNSYIYVYGGTSSTVHGSGLGSTGSMTGGGITNVLITGESTKVSGTVYGGSTNGTHVGDINLVIKNGTIGNTIYGGSSSKDITGNISITIIGGTMKSVIGGCTTGSVNGTVEVNIAGGNITGDIYTSGQGGTQEENTQYHVGGTPAEGTNGQILDIDSDRLSLLITGDKTVDSAAIVAMATGVNSSADQHHTDKTWTYNGNTYYYPQLYSNGYTRMLTGFTRGTYGNHGVTQYVIHGKKSFLSLATVEGVTLNITGGTIKGNIFGGGKVAVVNGDVDINIANATITGNIYGGGDGSVEPKVNIYVPTSKKTTTTYSFTWKGSETFNLDEYDPVHNLPIDWDKKYVYSPYYDYMGGVDGNVTINIGEGTKIIGNVFGGGNEGLVTGTVTVNTDNATITKAIFGGGNVGNVTNNIELIIDKTNAATVFGGGYSGRVEGTTLLDVSSSNITEVFGGGYSGPIIGNTFVTIDSGTYTNVFAGCDQAVVLGDTQLLVGNAENLVLSVSGVVYGGGRGVDNDGDGNASDFITVQGNSDVTIEGLNTYVGNYGSVKLGSVAGNVDVTFEDYWTGNITNKYKIMNGIDRATNVYFENAYVLLENKDENGNLEGIKDITNLYIPEGSGIKVSATGEILGDFHGGGTFYLDSEVCLTIRGNIYGKSLIILNPKLMEDGNVIKGSKNYPYMRILGVDESNGSALYSTDPKYIMLTDKEDSGATIYYIASDVYITDNIINNLINIEGKHYTDDIVNWPEEDFYISNAGAFSTDYTLTYSYLDDGDLGDLYKNVKRKLIMNKGEVIVDLPVGTNIVMITGGEYYKYRVSSNISEISLNDFVKMDDELVHFEEVEDVRSNSSIVGGNEIQKAYTYSEKFRFVVDFAETVKGERLLEGSYNLLLKFYDSGEESENAAVADNSIRIEEDRKYNMVTTLDREWYEQESNIVADVKMTSEYYILFDEADRNKEIIAMVSLKDGSGDYIPLSENLKFYVDDNKINHTSSNMKFVVIDGLTQQRMEVDKKIEIDVSNLTLEELLDVGKNTLCISYYLAEDGVFEKNVGNYELDFEVVKFNIYALQVMVKPETGLTEEALLNVNRTQDKTRIIQMEYIGDIRNPYISVDLEIKNPTDGTYSKVINTITNAKYESIGQIQNAEAIFGDSLSRGTYRLTFNLCTKYGDIKASEALIFECN